MPATVQRDRRRAGSTEAARVAITQAQLRRAGTLLRREAGGLVAGAVVLVLVLAFRVPSEATWPTGREAFCYWLPALTDPYARSDWTQPVAYVYSPAFLQAIAGLKALPWEAFLVAWTVILLLAVRFLVGRRFWAVAIAFAVLELLGGNIHLLLAVAVVIGFRWPAAWGFVLLTKVTPGVGLLWFAVRREWGSLGIAVGATAAVAAVSYAIAPGAWADWIDVLIVEHDEDGGDVGGDPGAAPACGSRRPPLIVTWGARTDRRWTVPVAAMVALPGPLVRRRIDAPGGGGARGGRGKRGGAPSRSDDAGGSRAAWRPRRAALRRPPELGRARPEPGVPVGRRRRPHLRAPEPRMMLASGGCRCAKAPARLVRDLAAIVVVAVACPAALFGGALVGGALLGCAADGLTPECALNGILDLAHPPGCRRPPRRVPHARLARPGLRDVRGHRGDGRRSRS